MEEYGQKLLEGPIHLACVGIGENGHIAFNDPPVADFEDKLQVKKVQLDEGCRKQQLGEGWFASFEETPEYAATLTVPAIMRAECISCVVVDLRKADAILAALHGEISTACPSSIMRKHVNTLMWLD